MDGLTLFFADAQPLSVVIASGQFTMPEDLSFEPLEELTQFCAQHKPDLLLLLGPFVDVDHPLIQSGMVDEAFEDMFDRLVCTCLLSRRLLATANWDWGAELMHGACADHHKIVSNDIRTDQDCADPVNQRCTAHACVSTASF